jgi:hypothetical protein
MHNIDNYNNFELEVLPYHDIELGFFQPSIIISLRSLHLVTEDKRASSFFT